MFENQEVDFYLLGQRRAKDGLLELKRIADSYEEKYGKAARDDFENGIASVIPQYAFAFPAVSEVKESEIQGATNNFGVENTRNNSYFDGTGTGIQYKPNGDYNPPSKGRR